MKKQKISRRKFLENSFKAGAFSAIALSGFPTIIPSSVLGRNAPSNRINIGTIGTGRISRVHDMPDTWKYDHANIMAVCDLDTKRANDAKALVNNYYSEKSGKTYDGVKVYYNY